MRSFEASMSGPAAIALAAISMAGDWMKLSLGVAEQTVPPYAAPTEEMPATLMVRQEQEK
jgi:hypothetical protein